MMIELGVVFGVYIMGSLFVISWIINRAREERRELENRLMAIASPEALILHKAHEEPTETSITYVDDESRSNGA